MHATPKTTPPFADPLARQGKAGVHIATEYLLGFLCPLTYPHPGPNYCAVLCSPHPIRCRYHLPSHFSAPSHFADPLVMHGKTRIRNANEYLRITEQLMKGLEEADFPFMVIHSENDTMCDCDGSKQLYMRAKVGTPASRLGFFSTFGCEAPWQLYLLAEVGTLSVWLPGPLVRPKGCSWQRPGPPMTTILYIAVAQADPRRSWLFAPSLRCSKHSAPLSVYALRIPRPAPLPALQSEDKQLRLPNHMWHVLMREDGNEKILEEIISWILERAA